MNPSRKMTPDERRRKILRDEHLERTAAATGKPLERVAKFQNSVNRHAAKKRPGIPPMLVATPGISPPLNLEGYAYDAACLAEWIAFLVKRGLL